MTWMLAARNLAWAARQHGAEFVLRAAGSRGDRTMKQRSVTLADGTDFGAGRPNRRRAAITLNRLAGAHRRHDDRPSTLATGGSLVVPAPAGTGLDEGGAPGRPRPRSVFRPQPGGSMMIGSTEPEHELVRVDDPDENSPYLTVDVWETAPATPAARSEFRVPERRPAWPLPYDVAGRLRQIMTV
ncbi:MAG: hypothetical protein R2697_07605 [Ilumatobacteraceae bacterium]